MISSAIIFGERPNAIEIVGMATIAVALLVLSIHSMRSGRPMSSPTTAD